MELKYRPVPEKAQGAIVDDPSLFTEFTGIDLHPKCYELWPTGARIHVAVDIKPETYGDIIIPETSQEVEEMCTGWIFAAGPSAHEQSNAYPYESTMDAPEHFLYQHIYFGLHTGKPMMLGAQDSKWRGSFLIMTPRDIIAFDEDPGHNPWDTSVERNRTDLGELLT